MFGLGFLELCLIAVVALLVFGPRRLPEFAKTIGKASGTLRRTLDEIKRDIDLDEPATNFKASNERKLRAETPALDQEQKIQNS